MIIWSIPALVILFLRGIAQTGSHDLDSPVPQRESTRTLDIEVISRATKAKAIPTSAQTIRDGKYEPKMLREGAPSQPQSKPGASAAHHNGGAGGKRRNASPGFGELIGIFMRGSVDGFSVANSPPFGATTSARDGSLAWIAKKTMPIVME
jgi:hypothetical protein